MQARGGDERASVRRDLPIEVEVEGVADAADRRHDELQHEPAHKIPPVEQQPDADLEGRAKIARPMKSTDTVIHIQAVRLWRPSSIHRRCAPVLAGLRSDVPSPGEIVADMVAPGTAWQRPCTSCQKKAEYVVSSARHLTSRQQENFGLASQIG